MNSVIPISISKNYYLYFTEFSLFVSIPKLFYDETKFPVGNRSVKFNKLIKDIYLKVNNSFSNEIKFVTIVYIDNYLSSNKIEKLLNSVNENNTIEFILDVTKWENLHDLLKFSSFFNKISNGFPIYLYCNSKQYKEVYSIINDNESIILIIKDTKSELALLNSANEGNLIYSLTVNNFDVSINDIDQKNGIFYLLNFKNLNYKKEESIDLKLFNEVINNLHKDKFDLDIYLNIKSIINSLIEPSNVKFNFFTLDQTNKRNRLVSTNSKICDSCWCKNVCFRSRSYLMFANTPNDCSLNINNCNFIRRISVLLMRKILAFSDSSFHAIKTERNFKNYNFKLLNR